MSEKSDMMAAHLIEYINETEHQLCKAHRNVKELEEEIVRLRTENTRLLEVNAREERSTPTTTFDYHRFVAWIRDVNRQPACLAFTSGVLRSCATAFEFAHKQGVSGPARGLKDHEIAELVSAVTMAVKLLLPDYGPLRMTISAAVLRAIEAQGLRIDRDTEGVRR